MASYPVLGSVLLGAAFSTFAVADVEVSDAYVRGLPPGVANTAAYMKLVNNGNEPVELTHASSPVAGSVMLHSTTEHDGMLHMMHVDSVTIAAQGELLLQSGGLHLMLMELRETLRDGDEAEITLHFSDGSVETFMAPVRSVLNE